MLSSEVRAFVGQIVQVEYADKDGRQWKDLDVAQLVQNPEFLAVGV